MSSSNGWCIVNAKPHVEISSIVLGPDLHNVRVLVAAELHLMLRQEMPNCDAVR